MEYIDFLAAGMIAGFGLSVIVRVVNFGIYFVQSLFNKI